MISVHFSLKPGLAIRVLALHFAFQLVREHCELAQNCMEDPETAEIAIQTL
jgi:hypothetical protein